MASRIPGSGEPPEIPHSDELDFSDSGGDDFEALSRDRIPTRSMEPRDLDDIVEIDRRLTGRDRRAYYERLMSQAMDEGGVRVSLVVEQDGRVIGYVMARVDYGEFGRTEPVAVMDTIGIHPDFHHREIGSALMSQLVANLAALMIERVRTVVPWENFELQAFLRRNGFAPAQRLALWCPLD